MTASRRALATLIAKEWHAGTFGRARIRSLAAYLLSHNRTSEVAPLVRDIELARLTDGFLEVKVASARPLSLAALRSIRAQAKQLYPASKHLHVITTIDTALIGGARVVVGEYELDVSVRGRFEHFSAVALKGGR